MGNAQAAGSPVLLYADSVTDSMQRAIDETNRRRAIQVAYNEEHGITPTTIKKKVAELLDSVFAKDYVTVDLGEEGGGLKTEEEREKLPEIISEIRERMVGLANELKFEEAAELRDQIHRLEKLYLETS